MWQTLFSNVGYAEWKLWLLFAGDVLCKATFILFAAMVAVRFLRHRSAAARHSVWAMTIAGVLAIPFVSLFLPGWGPVRHVMSGSSQPSNLAARETTSSTSVVALEASPALSSLAKVPIGLQTANVNTDADAVAADGITFSGNSIHPTIRDDANGSTWTQGAAIVWLTGLTVSLIPLLFGLMRVESIRRRANPIESNSWLSLLASAANQLRLRRRVNLRQGILKYNPLTGGVIWPFVLLPPTSDGWQESKRRFVLLHELAHVKRWDVLTQWLARLTCAVFWFHPLVWYAARRMRIERERACDDLVLAAGTNAADYSQQLIEFARVPQPSRLLAASMLGMASPSDLVDRVRRILDGNGDRRPFSKRVLLIATFIATAAVAGIATAGRIIVKDAQGNVVATVNVPQGGSVTIDDEREKVKTKAATTYEESALDRKSPKQSVKTNVNQYYDVRIAKRLYLDILGRLPTVSQSGCIPKPRVAVAGRSRGRPRTLGEAPQKTRTPKAFHKNKATRQTSCITPSA